MVEILEESKIEKFKAFRGFFTVGENIQHDAEFSMTMNFSLLKSALKVKDL